jgi:SAM-dependent methyltransferase
VTFRDRFLGTSIGYQTFKRVIGADRAMAVFAKEYIDPKPTDRLLDIGCGIGDMLPFLDGACYVGIDLNTQYIETAKREHPEGQFINASVDDLPSLGLDDFDCAFAIGVLHHLRDDQVEALVESLPGALKPSGRLVTVDPVWSPEQPTTARVLASLDRGRHVRDIAGYTRLLEARFSVDEFVVRGDLLRVPYSYSVSRSQLVG